MACVFWAQALRLADLYGGGVLQAILDPPPNTWAYLCVGPMTFVPLS